LKKLFQNCVMTMYHRNSEPPEFLCPISMRLMKDPVVVVETGQIYDRESIERWFENSNLDPLTGQSVKNTALTPVHSLRSIIESSQRRKVSSQSCATPARRCASRGSLNKYNSAPLGSYAYPLQTALATPTPNVNTPPANSPFPSRPTHDRTPNSDASSIGLNYDTLFDSLPGSCDGATPYRSKRERAVQVEIIKDPDRLDTLEVRKRFKVSFTGPPEVGKSSLIDRMRNGCFDSGVPKTTGVDLVTLGVKLGDSLTQLDIWDTAGEENFQSASKLHLRGSQLICLVYDVTRPKTLEKALGWLNVVRATIEHCTIFLLGNKSDCLLSDERWEDAVDTGQAFADKHELIYFTTSAKTGAEVEAVLVEMTRTLRALSPISGGFAVSPSAPPELLKKHYRGRGTISLHRDFHRRTSSALMRQQMQRSGGCCSKASIQRKPETFSQRAFCEPRLQDVQEYL